MGLDLYDMLNLLHKIIRLLLQGNPSGVNIPPGYKELADTILFFHTTIGQLIHYYNNLPEAGKLRFLKRVYHFRNNKQFHYIGLEAKPEMPVLISAAAVQLTFGLRSYLLLFFKNIYLTPDAYHAKNLEGLYVGHVSPTGIYISWKHFLEGFNNNTDGVNTALHEMAHAVRHQNFMKEHGLDKEFVADF